MDATALLTDEQVSAMIGKSAKTLARWRRAGEGPPWARLGKTPLYQMSDLLVWMVRNRVDPHDAAKPITDGQ